MSRKLTSANRDLAREGAGERRLAAGAAVVLAGVPSIAILEVGTIVAIAILVVLVTTIVGALRTAVRTVFAPAERAAVGEGAATISVEGALGTAIPVFTQLSPGGALEFRGHGGCIVLECLGLWVKRDSVCRVGGWNRGRFRLFSVQTRATNVGGQVLE